jgi:hypothetical protein
MCTSPLVRDLNDKTWYENDISGGPWLVRSTTHRGMSGKGTESAACGAEERKNSASKPITREFYINPRVTIVGKKGLLQHSPLGVPTSWYTQSCCHQQHFLTPFSGNCKKLHHFGCSVVNPHSNCQYISWRLIVARGTSHNIFIKFVQIPKFGEVAPV